MTRVADIRAAVERRLRVKCDAALAEPSNVAGCTLEECCKLLDMAMATSAGMSKLFLLAKYSEQAECLRLVVEHAIASSREDELWLVMLGLARKWAKNDIDCSWDNETVVISAVNRLMVNVDYRHTEVVLLALNPRNGLWFAPFVDFDEYWQRVISHELEYRMWDKAFNSLLCAGIGVDLDDQEELRAGYSTEEAWFAIQEAQDYKLDDALTYGRAQKSYQKLIRTVWDAFALEGLLAGLPDTQLVSRKIRVKVKLRLDERNAPYRSLVGLLTRGAEHLTFEDLDRGLKRPMCDKKTVLTIEMAMLQQMVISFRKSRGARLRKTRSTFQAAS